MLTGPSVVNCFNSENSFGQCLQGKLAEAGLLPAPEQPPAVAQSEQPAAEPVNEAEVPAEPALDIAEPALDVEPPAAPAEAPDSLVAASFGLLRAEPDGSVVIAGSGTPGSEVEIFASGALLGSATVETSGDWVLVPDAPLPHGPLEITLGEKGKTGQAAQSFVVVVNEDKTSQPLVVASTPGEASDILQGLERPVSDEVTRVAVADPVQPPASEAPAVPAEPPASEPSATDPATSSEAPASQTVADEPATSVPDTEAQTETVAAAPDVDAAMTTDEPAAAIADPVSAPEPVVDVAPAEPADQPADEPASSEPEASATEPDVQIAAIEETPADTPDAVPALASIPPTIDAIELEGDKTFFAGGGPEGGVIRLYVDDRFIADATIAVGRWLIEAGPVLDKPSQRIRVDLLQPGSGTVVARAEVDFVVDLPEAAEPVAVADADADADSPTEVPEAAVEPQEPVAVVSETEVAEQDQLADAPSVAQAPASPITPEAVSEPAPAVPTMVAVSFGGVDAQRFAAGKAIIRRGDNLWTIARRVYGTGVKFTTIYEANTGQIRDPHRIYPGQVFNLPTE